MYIVPILNYIAVDENTDHLKSEKYFYVITNCYNGDAQHLCCEIAVSFFI